MINSMSNNDFVSSLKYLINLMIANMSVVMKANINIPVGKGDNRNLLNI